MLDNQYFGLYRGICKDNQDPTNHDRIKVAIPDLYGNDYMTDWIPGCMPVVTNADHPDHKEHTAAQVAALLTTTSVSASGGDPQGGTVSITIPALTVVAKTGAGTLKHDHKTSTDLYDTQTTTPEHTYHRTIPNLEQVVWIMFEKGDPNFPVWMGVYN